MQPPRPFVLTLRELEEGETHVEMVGGPADIGLRADEVVLVGPVVLRARVFRARERVEVQGRLAAQIDLVCDRCLEPVRVDLRHPVRVFSEREEKRDRRSREERREEDLGILYHDGQSIDLADEIRQSILVETPWHVLCSEACRGLCPRCGRNLNRDVCMCAPFPAPDVEQGSGGGN